MAVYVSGAGSTVMAVAERTGQRNFIRGWNRAWWPSKAWTDVKHLHCCAWTRTTPARRLNDRGTGTFCTFTLWL